MTHASPSGVATTATRIKGMITARRYAIRCGRCTGAGVAAIDPGAITGCPSGPGGGGTNGGGGAAMYGCDSCGGVHLGSTLDMRKRSEIAVQVPREECGRDPASLPCYLITHLARVTPATFE